jgi:hypothetical protein
MTRGPRQDVMLAPGQTAPLTLASLGARAFGALRLDAMMADAVGVRPSKQEARSVVYGAPPPRTNGTGKQQSGR